MFKSPIPYNDDVEIPEDDEEATRRELVATLLTISAKTFKDSGHALRGVHAKGQGLLRGELTVLDGLPIELTQGLFSSSREHPVVMRFSTSPGDILDDSVSTPRGLAIKVLDVEGERLPGSEGDRTQDFLLVDGPAFGAPTAKAFLATLKWLARTTDQTPDLKKAIAAGLRGLEAVVEAAGGESGTLKSLGAHPRTNLLGETFYSQAPIRYGDYIAKIAAVPLSQNLTALRNAPLDPSAGPNALREVVKSFFRDQGAVWDLRAQLRRDVETMPVEDSSRPWSEQESPYLTVGHITVNRQESWSEERVLEIDDGMAFSPWHGLSAHRPLGSIMRVRRTTYEASAEFRGRSNGCPIVEPRSQALEPA